MPMKQDPRPPGEASSSSPVPDPLVGLRPSLRKAQIRILLLAIFIEPFLMLFKGRRYIKLFLSRCGVFPRGTTEGSLWIHAIGMGEMRVANTIVRALPEDLPVVITSSYQIMQSFLSGQEALSRRVVLTLLPFPFEFAIRGFLRRFAPRQLVVVEATDLTPLVCLHMVQREIPTALVNGWVNKSWFDLRPSVPLLERLQILGVRGEEDRDLLARIGVPEEKITVIGEIKFDVVSQPLPDIESEVRKLAGERPILIAGSTHPDEEPQILDAFESLGGGDRALLILAPRLKHDLSAKLLRKRGLSFVRRSHFPVSGRPAVVLLDQMGELASLYRLAAAAFVGNSLSPHGRGHNPIEPASFAVPIAVGPNMEHFQLHADLFDRAGAWQRVADAGELARTWRAWLDSPELAREVGKRAADLIESQRGRAIVKTLELLRPFLGLDRAT